MPETSNWKLSDIWLSCVICSAKLLGLLLACPNSGIPCARLCRISMSSVRIVGGLLDAIPFPFPGAVQEWAEMFIPWLTSLTSLMLCLCLVSSSSFFSILSKYFWAWLASCAGVLEGTKYSEMNFHAPRPRQFTPCRKSLHLHVAL